MDKKIFNKSSNFFKKEGFYVILFVCLCVVATVAAVATKNNKTAKAPNKEVAVKDSSNKIDEPKDNALQVKKDEKKVADSKTTSATQGKTGIEVSKSAAEAGKATSNSKAVSSTNNNAWGKPVAGKVIEPYREALKETNSGSGQTNVYMVIEAKQDADVLAAFDGKIEKISDDEYGRQVVVDHNGYKTVYANLQEKVNVSEGKTIRKGEKIGKVNGTAIAHAKVNCLYVQLLDKSQKDVLGNAIPIDPAKYIKY